MRYKMIIFCCCRCFLLAIIIIRCRFNRWAMSKGMWYVMDENEKKNKSKLTGWKLHYQRHHNLSGQSHHNNHVQCSMPNNIQCKTKISLKNALRQALDGISTHKQQLICVNFSHFSSWACFGFYTFKLGTQRVWKLTTFVPHNLFKTSRRYFRFTCSQINRLIICNLQITHLMRFGIVRKCKYPITSYRRQQRKKTCEHFIVLSNT